MSTAYSPPDAMIERSARAIFAEYYRGTRVTWDAAEASHRYPFLQQARAALLAAHPVITTAEELDDLQFDSLLLNVQTGQTIRWTRSVSQHPHGRLLASQRLIVVWSPEDVPS